MSNCRHELKALQAAIAQSAVTTTAGGGYRLALPDATVFTSQAGPAQRWETSHFARLARALTRRCCRNKICSEFWRQVEPALAFRLAQYVRACAAVGPLVDTYRRISAYLPPGEVRWWLRQGPWLERLESVRAAAEEAFLLAAAVGAAEQLRALTRGELVELDLATNDQFELTALGSLLEDAVLREVLPAVVSATAPRASSSLAPPLRRLQLVWSAPG